MTHIEGNGKTFPAGAPTPLPVESTQSKETEIFQAIPRQPTNWAKEGLSLSAKAIFFPVTATSYGLRRYAMRKGVCGTESRVIDDAARAKLLKRGGEVIEFKSEDGKCLEGMFFDKGGDKTILICSGSHKSYEHYTTPMVDHLLKMGHDVMVFNYRGFGNSNGHTTEKGVYLDAEAAYQYLRDVKGIEPSRIKAWGYSLGGGVAVELATHHNVDIVLDRTFASMANVAEREAEEEYSSKAMGKTAKGLFKAYSHFNNVEKLKHVKGRIFIARGTDDDTMSEKELARVKRAIEKGKLASFEKLEKSGDVVCEEMGIAHEHDDYNLWFGLNPFTRQAKRSVEKFLKD